MSRRNPVTLALLAFGLLAGCQGGQVGGPGPSIDTVVDPTEARAGQAVSVRCEVRDDDGNLVEWTAQASVEPATGIALDGGTATPTIVGTYTFTCRSDAPGMVDDTPAILTVHAADPASTVATVDPATSPAGAPAAVACAVFDAYGNPIADAKTSVDPVEGLAIDGLSVSAEKVGTYDIGCSVEGFTVTKTTARFTVIPADPKRLDVTGTPEKDVYALDENVVVGWRVFDAFDNEIKGLPATVTPPADDGMKPLGGNKFKFTKEGHYRVHVALDAPWQAVENSRIFVCDVSAPEIVDLFPPRGYTQTGDPALVVHGTLKDAASSAIQSVTVNGAPATVHEDGSFEFPTSGGHGLNVLVIVATDEFGYEVRTTRGWYFSTGWVKVDDATTIDDTILPESVLLNLGQKFLDDGDHDPAHPNDLATLIELVLGGAIQPLLANLPPFDFPIPNLIDFTILGVRLQGGLDVGVTLKNVVLGQPRVDMDLMDGGIAAGIQFQPVSIGLDLTFTIHAQASGFGQTVDLANPSTSSSGSLTIGTLGVSVALEIAKPLGSDLTVNGKDFQLTLTDVNISPLESLKINLGKIFNNTIDLGTWDLTSIVGPINTLLSQYVLNPLINLITQPLIDLLEPLVVGVVGDAIKQVLGMLNLRQSFPLPDLLGTGKTVDLGIALGISSILFTEDAGRIGLDLGFATTKGVTREPPLGSILRDQCDGTEDSPPQFVFPADPSVQVGLTHDVLNELLFMVWWSGMLQGEFDASGLLGGGGGGGLGGMVDNIVIKPTLWLPPIINDCRERTQRIQIGDTFLEIQMDLLGNTQWLEVWLQADAEVEIVATGDQVGLKIGKIQKLEYELYDVGGGLGDLLGMVEGFLPDLLKGIEGQEFAFPIPAIPLDGILPGIPAGTSLQLGDLSASVDLGVIRFGGNLK